MKPIFVSSGVFPSKNISKILQTAHKNNLRNIELSSGLNYHPDLESLLNKYSEIFQFKFLIHNYFPPPEKAFVLNLASADETIINKSLRLCQRAINLCAELKIPFYSVHSGFAFDPGMDSSVLGNRRQATISRIPLEKARAIFTKNIKQLSSYARKQNVKLAIENNVVADFAVVNGENQLCLGATADDLSEIFEKVNDDNLYLLFDLGHAKVNCHTLHAGIDRIIDVFHSKIIGVHLSDNDGSIDDHRALDPASDILKYGKKIGAVYYVLEAYNLSLRTIKAQIKLIKNYAG